MEKKISQYDDSFYALEASKLRDRMRMEEMAKAKAQAEEEKGIFRGMLEQVRMERGVGWGKGEGEGISDEADSRVV